MLSSRAVLSSVGVGDSTASPTAALLLSVLQESAGRIATILFAHRFGTALEPECKMYRLLADILNDLAFVLDCLSPAFPKPVRVIILSFSSMLRALCGVAAGSAKASLSAHFARWGNLGELNAKDSSQETVISLLGMLTGSVVVTYVTTAYATWSTLILLLAIHLEMNRRAVRAVSMRSLNRQRATLVYHDLMRGRVPTPHQISQEEWIFERDGVLRDAQNQTIGYASIGGSLGSLLSSASRHQNTVTASMVLQGPNLLRRLLATFKDHEFLIWYHETNIPVGGERDFQIVLKRHATARDILIAWWAALAVRGLAGVKNEEGRDDGAGEILANLSKAVLEAKALLTKSEGELSELGWDLDSGAMETRSSSRVEVGAVG